MGWVFMTRPSFQNQYRYPVQMIKLEIVTPERRLVDVEADSVTVPTVRGEIGLLKSHAPMISAIKPGILAYTIKGERERFVVSGGFVEVSSDKVSVLADIAEPSSEIDAKNAQSEKAVAEKELAGWTGGSEQDFEMLKDRLELAEARLRIVT
jgi:F-type H+-transporting ATPase subunit epsilon